MLEAPGASMDVTDVALSRIDMGYTISDLTNDEWFKLIQTVTEKAHNSDLAPQVGHRDGFCIACAEIYVAISGTIVQNKPNY